MKSLDHQRADGIICNWLIYGVLLYTYFWVFYRFYINHQAIIYCEQHDDYYDYYDYMLIQTLNSLLFTSIMSPTTPIDIHLACYKILLDEYTHVLICSLL